MGLASLLGLLSVAPSAARAAQTRELQRTFGASSALPPNVADPYPLTNPQGVAVNDSTGDVYVADTGNNRIEKFAPNGEFLLMFGGDVNPLASNPDLCAVMETCKEGTEGSAPGEFEHAQFIAIDQSTGDVYVADTASGIVSKFSPEGVLEEKSWGTKGQLNGSTTKAGSFGAIAGIAVDATGTMYVANTGLQLFEFEEDSKISEEVTLVGSEFHLLAAKGLAIDGQGRLFATVGGADGGYINGFNATGPDFGPLGPREGAANVLALAGGPEGGVYYTTPSTLGHFAFNSEGEVIEPDGSACPFSPPLNFSGCPPTDSIPIKSVSSGIGVTGAGGVVVSNAGEGLEYSYSPLVTIPKVTTSAPTTVAPRALTLSGKINPEGIQLKTCEFEYVEAESYEASAPNPYALGKTAACEEPDAAEIEAVSESFKVHAKVTGLNPGVTYDYRLTATNENDETTPVVGLNESAETLPPPSIDSATVSGLTANSAVLNVEINPEGTETHYYFEYDTRPYAKGEGAHGVRVPATEGEDPSIRAGFGDVPRSASINGLEAGRYTYYWRVVATNDSGSTTSFEHTFIYEVANPGLPDGRAYELVTPAHKNGADVGDVSILEGAPEIAADGSLVMAKAIQCYGDAQSCYGDRKDAIGVPAEFTRTSSGWVATALSPSASEFEAVTSWATDPEKGGNALFSMPTPPFYEDDFYVRESGTGNFEDMGPNTPPEDHLRGTRGGKPAAESQVFTANFSHFAWDEGPGEAHEYVGVGNARPLQVNLSGGEGSSTRVGCGTWLGDLYEAPRGTMSADGQTIFFSSESCQAAFLSVYARIDGESPEAHTVALSAPSCGAGTGSAEVACREALPADAMFVGAAQDGADAFFTSAQQLTDNATEDADSADEFNDCHEMAGPNGCNLYEYEGVTAQNATERRLVDVSEGEGGAPITGGPRVQGVLAVSQQGAGERVYFVAKGVLTTAERPGCMAEWTAVGRGPEALCHAIEGAANVYVYSDETHGVSFVTDLAPGEHGDEEEWIDGSGNRANVTPDGRFLVFVSRARLTADDTSLSDADQVFRYDAQTQQLQRLSFGYRGFNDDGNRPRNIACSTEECNEDAQIVYPYKTPRSDPTMSDDGSRVFFTSPEALTPHALNNVQTGVIVGIPRYARNVYEWESAGVGSCPAERSAGCVWLISDGRDVSANDAAAFPCLPGGAAATCLLGSDATGNNVFFATDDSLVESDTNSEVDFYDARVCEPERGDPCIQPPLPGVPPCAGEECHGVPAGVPGIPLAPSETFNGAGNVASAPAAAKPTATVLTRAQRLAKALKTCRAMKSKHKRLTCEAVARKRYGPAHQKKKAAKNFRPSSKRSAR